MHRWRGQERGRFTGMVDDGNDVIEPPSGEPLQAKGGYAAGFYAWTGFTY